MGYLIQSVGVGKFGEGFVEDIIHPNLQWWIVLVREIKRKEGHSKLREEHKWNITGVCN